MRTISPQSRRAFLRGAGGASLAIPFLPSLAPVGALAAERGPTRFAMVYTKYGNHFKSWWTNTAPTTPSADGSYRSRTLSDIEGDLSPILGAPFGGPIRKKIAVVRGLDPYCVPMAHNSTFATTADAGENGGMFLHDRLRFHFSVDTVLEESPRFYPTRPALGALRLTTGRGIGSWSWTSRNGILQNVIRDATAQAAYDRVFKNAQTDPTVGALNARLRALTGAVHEDFKRTIGSRRISAHDKVRLDNFMSLVSQIRTKLDAPTVACARNGDVEARAAAQDDFDKMNAVMMDIELAALACGTTKIVMHGLGSFGPALGDASDLKWHDIGHAVDARSLAASKWHAEKFADFIKKLDSLTDPDGNTVLDNTLVVYANEDCTGGHFLMDMPIIVAGGKGRIKTDQYIDYRNLNDPLRTSQFLDSSGHGRSMFFGRPYNNFLISVLKAFGLAEADYKRYPDQDGYGRYTGGHGASHYTKFVSTSSERNAPLPGLFTG